MPPVTRKKRTQIAALNRQNSNQLQRNSKKAKATQPKSPNQPKSSSFKNAIYRMSTSYASGIPVDRACVSAFNLLGRILSKSSKYGAGYGSLNTYGGFWPMLDAVMSGLKRPLLMQPYGLARNASSSIYYAGTSSNWWKTVFSSSQAITGGAAMYGSFIPIAAQLSFEVNSMIKSGVNTVSGAKPAARRILSGLSVVKSLMLILVLLSGYISHIGPDGQAEIQGLYYYYILLQSLYEVFMKDKMQPIFNFLIKPVGVFKQMIQMLKNGIICPEIEQINNSINS